MLYVSTYWMPLFFYENFPILYSDVQTHALTETVKRLIANEKKNHNYDENRMQCARLENRTKIKF